MSHTKEPWVDVEGIIYPANGREDGQDWIADCRSAGNHKNIARRIVACMNACAQITTEELESVPSTGGILGPRADVARIAQQRDELLAALKTLINSADDVADAELENALESDDRATRDQANAFLVGRAAIAKAEAAA